MEEVSSTEINLIDGEAILRLRRRRLRVVTVACILTTWSFAYGYSAVWGEEFTSEFRRIFGVQYHHFALSLLPLIPDVLIAVLLFSTFWRRALLPFCIGTLPLAFMGAFIGGLWMLGAPLVLSLAVLCLASHVVLVVGVWKTFDTPENWGILLAQALVAVSGFVASFVFIAFVVMPLKD